MAKRFGFLLGSLFWLVGSAFTIDLNFGVQFGLSKTETDYIIHPGIAFRFNFQ
jgi:hypothetical protein